MPAAATAWIDSRLEGGVRVVTILADRLDKKLHSRQEFAQTLADALAAGERRFVLDLSNIRYTNHTYGILQLAFTAGNVIHGSGSRMAVCGLKGHPRRAYLFADVDQFIPEYRKLSQAIAAVRG
ncbi:MAG: hypothetical protein JNL18_16535 [Planctomycetaceae bacterium]|jgi:hypothetical protein|nr:hypothetical protein [Planctomycetaceae bacterium]